jgi:hypothetical protein
MVLVDDMASDCCRLVYSIDHGYKKLQIVEFDGRLFKPSGLVMKNSVCMSQG